MARGFTLGRSNETLMNDAHFNIFKVMEHFLNYPSNPEGPGPDSDKPVDEINDGSLWLDRTTNSNSADLKYYEDGIWKLIFGDRWKLICNLLSPTEPEDPVEGELWINPNGILMYFYQGKWKPIKSIQYEEDELSLLEYEDFLIISPLKSAERTVTNNFNKFVFTNGITEWKPNIKYNYQQGVSYNGKIYVCLRSHYSNTTNGPDNTRYWTCLEILIQFLLPNSDTDKLFINGTYIHERIGKSLEDYIVNRPHSNWGVIFDDGENPKIYRNVGIVSDDGTYVNTKFIFEDEESELVTDNVLDFTIGEGVTEYIEDEETLKITLSDLQVKDEELYIFKTKEEEIIDKQNEDEEGYIRNTNISCYLKWDDVEKTEAEKLDSKLYEKDSDFKLVTAVHVNPKRLSKINKTLIKLNKATRIVPIQKENTEYYGIKDGIGTLLIENTDNKIFDYVEKMYNGKLCIQINQECANKYDFIYCINYEFKKDISRQGKLFRRRVNLSNETNIYIGFQNINNIMVFADGLYYEQTPMTYSYNEDDGYIYLKEDLMHNSSERMDITVIKFPKVSKGKVLLDEYKDDNYIAGRGYRVELESLPYDQQHCLGFISGICTDFNSDFGFYEDDTAAVYLKNVTKEYLQAHGNVIYWAIVDTDLTKDGEISHSMLRGKFTCETLDSFETGIRVSRDKETIIPGEVYLDYTESPILIVDGLVMSQKDITITENYLIIDSLSDGQEVYVLADTNEDVDIEEIVTELPAEQQWVLDETLALVEYDTGDKVHEEDDSTSYVYEDLRYNFIDVDFSPIQGIASDSVLFDDGLGANVIQTEKNNSTVVYLRQGLICDEKAVRSIDYPKEPKDGQIVYLKNSLFDSWSYYSEANKMWLPYVNTNQISKEALGYYADSNSITILRDIDIENRYCTYFAYKYGNAIEKELQVGYLIPDGIKGTSDNKFSIKSSYSYTPTRNELSIYINGLLQKLSNEKESDFYTSDMRECLTSVRNLVEITDNGQPIEARSGWYTYKLVKDDKVTFEWSTEEKVFSDYDSVELISKPTENVIFYVIEKCEGTEVKACEREWLTYKDALASKGAYYNNSYETSLDLTAGNLKVFINGIRQPSGIYMDEEGNKYQSYKVINENLIKFINPLIGGLGGNLGDLDNPKYPINPDNPKSFYVCLDNILIETRTDNTLKEITLPLPKEKYEFDISDIPDETLFETSDFVMIYINGLAYGSNYKIDNNKLKLKDKDSLRTLISENEKNFITIEWR